MSAKHTPGPWVATRNIAYWEINASRIGEPYQPIGNACATAPRDADGGLQEANARLMAASPDLLSTLKHLVRWHDQLGKEDIARAEAVIAKAEARS